MKRTQLIVGAAIYLSVTVGGYLLISANTPYRALERVAPVSELTRAADSLSLQLTDQMQTSLKTDGGEVVITKAGNFDVTDEVTAEISKGLATFEDELNKSAAQYAEEWKITAEITDYSCYDNGASLAVIDSDRVEFTTMVNCSAIFGDWVDETSAQRTVRAVYSKKTQSIDEVTVAAEGAF